ncbi:MAG TPA: hypothetical protein QF641_02075 [Candidatus Thalassarchaeaceae archaeon]|nr:hypothetical protein [Candidatus Thalassarchaeaceae archaeon]
MSNPESRVCECCKAEVEGSREKCQVCELLIPHITGQNIGLVQDPDTISDFRAELGYPGLRPSQIWSRIRSMQGEGREWAFSEGRGRQDRISCPPPAWSLSEEDISAISHRPSGIEHEQTMRRLARGGLLPDGSHLCFANGLFFLDGRPCSIPHMGLMKILTRHPEISRKVNWKQLLRSVDLACTKLSVDYGMHPGNSPLYHPASLLASSNTIEQYRIMEMLHRHMRPPRSTRTQRWMFMETEWLQRWEWSNISLTSDSTEDELKVPPTLSINRGRLQLRARRNSGWKKMELDSCPRVWSTIVTWVLSPPDHEDHRRIRTLQQHIFSDVPMRVVEGKDVNGINFLRNVLEANERANISLDGSEIHVRGTSELRYSVRPGRGGHSTRFVVHPVMGGSNEPPARNGWARMHQRMARYDRAICIVERPELRRLVLGDAIGTIVLTLLDDLSSQRHIDTLRSHISRHRPRQALDPDMAAHNRAEELRYQLARNRIARVQRRCVESFPRFWGVLLRMPLGSRMTFTAINRNGPPNVSFDDSETTFRTSNMVDRQVIYRMLEASGWIRDKVEEGVRNTLRIYIRTGTGERDLGNDVEEIAGMLEPRLVVNGRIRVLPAPLWSMFERVNPGTAALLPGTDQHIR